MKRVCLSAALLPLLVPALLVAEEGRTRLLGFGKDSVGKLPAGWKAGHTGKGGAGAWKVVADDTAPSKAGHALAQTELAYDTSLKDVEVSLGFEANKGKRDQGGGIVWRYADANNYYLARMNPLEDNYRGYKVVAGKRVQLGTKEGLKVPAGEWHALRVKQAGDRIECYLDGKKELKAKDDTFRKAGKVGLWTKADAQTSFDEFKVTDLAR
jgi:hypothetical protein